MTKPPEMRRYAVEQVSALLGRLVFQVHRALRSHDPEVAHDLRVSIRRFNQGTRVFRQFFPVREVKKIRRRLHAIMEAAAEVRDRDIALELCAAAALPDSSPLRGELAAQRQAAEAEMRDLLKRFEAGDYSSRWRARLGLG